MTTAEKLRALRGERIIPIFRKTGSQFEGIHAFNRDRDTERVMDALPYIADVVELAENFWGDATPPEEFTRALTALDDHLEV